MKEAARRMREEEFHHLMRLLVEAKGVGERLGLGDIGRLVDMAVLGVAVEWTEIDPALACDAKLEAVAKDCLRRACRKEG